MLCVTIILRDRASSTIQKSPLPLSQTSSSSWVSSFQTLFWDLNQSTQPSFSLHRHIKEHKSKPSVKSLPVLPANSRTSPLLAAVVANRGKIWEHSVQTLMYVPCSCHAEYHRIRERPGLEGTLNIVSFQSHCVGQGLLQLD